MDRFAIRGCKKLGPLIEVRPECATDALHDALCKVAILYFEEPEAFSDHISRAYQFVARCRRLGRPWKLREIRDLERRADDEAEFRAAIAAEEAARDRPPARCDTPTGSPPADRASRAGRSKSEKKPQG